MVGMVVVDEITTDGGTGTEDDGSPRPEKERRRGGAGKSILHNINNSVNSRCQTLTNATTNIIFRYTQSLHDLV